MSSRDLLFICAALSGIVGGLLLPGVAPYISWAPRTGLMIMLYLSFLGLDTRSVLADAVRLRGRLTVMVLGKLCLSPLLTFALFAAVMPRFALGTLLLAGTPAGVVSVFLCTMVRADFTLALAGVIITSLLSPFTLPLMTSLALPYLGYDSQALAAFSPVEMSLNMALLILVPYTAAQITQRLAPRMVPKIISLRLVGNAACLGISNVAMFSKYAIALRASPDLMIPGFGAALFCGLLFFMYGVTLSWRWPLSQQATMGLCIGVSNATMGMILGMEFFGIYEALPGAFFAVPTVLMLVPARLFIRWRSGGSSEVPPGM